MDGNFMFVPTSYKDQREKELIYAACKAHATRRASRKRRPQADGRRKPGPKSALDIGLREQPLPRAITSRMIRINDIINGQQIPTTTLPMPLFSLSHSDILSGARRPRVSSEMMQAISFTRFHLARSWSPNFMLRLVSGSMNGVSFEHAQAQRATQWMWQLWTSNVFLFWSVVASVMPTMIPHLPPGQKSDAQKMALELKERSFNGLRDMLHDDSPKSAGKLLVTAYHVKSLFREACASGDTQAASYHCQMLAQLAGKLIESSPTIEFHRIALWGDALPALLQLRRPVVDFKVELAQIVQNIWTVAEPILPDTRMVNFELPGCLLNHTLREAFLHLKRAVYILNVSMVTTPDEQLTRVELLFQWLTTKAEHYTCRLLNMYHDLIEPTGTAELLGELSEGERQVQAALALALLFAYQKSFFDICEGDGVDINESANVVVPALKKTLQCVERDCSKSEQLFSQDAIFWITVVGVWAERRPTISENSGNVSLEPSDAENHWFESELSRYASDPRLNSWSKAKKVLNGFVWNDSWDPNAGKWYSGIIRLEKKLNTAH